MIISERIFNVMEQKNITQLELSRRTGIATSNISDWKKKKTNPKADCLLSICDALDITPEQLLTGKGIDSEYKDADMDYEVTSVLAYWYLVKYFWLLLPFYGTIKETAVISYGKTKKVQNQTYG